MAKTKKKPTAKQLAARAKFTKIMKSGGFKKKSKSKKSIKSTSKKNHSKSTTRTRRSRGGSASDITKESKALLLAINDPRVKEIRIIK